MSTNLKKVTTLVFDWDGTLVDSARLGLEAFQKTFDDLDLPFPLDVYEATYSPNWYATYAALGVPESQWKYADSRWLSHYGEQCAPLLPNVAATLLELQKRGYRLGVVSSGSETRVCREMVESQLSDLFAAVICNEHIENKKPHPEGLEKALRQMGSANSETAYVGDAPEDIQMGQHAGVYTVGVRSEYPSSRRIAAANPDLLLESIADLTLHFYSNQQSAISNR